MKTKALELYMQDMPGSKIAKKVSEEFSIVISAPVIYSWIRKGKWDEERDKAKERALALVSAEKTGNVAEITRRHFGVYDKVIDKGEEYLDHNPNFEKTSDAVKAIDIGVQGQRKVMSGIVSVQLILDLVDIVRSEINDEETLQRISAKAAELAAKYAE